MKDKEPDEDGQLTLEVISKANRFNQWMFETIEPYCSGKLLEIGSGIGNISKFFLEQGYQIALSDIRQNYCEYLQQKFSHQSNLIDILQLDLVDAEFQNKYEPLREKFDTLFSLNVIEHIEDDALAIKNASYLLKKGGRLIILVPAYNWLFNHFDKALGHFRRYNRKSLIELFVQNRLKIRHVQYFNLAGIPGWFFSGRIQKNKTIPGTQMKFYNQLVPFFRILDKITINVAGLSVIAIGIK
jgi:SAM-dependent methyltransferase